MQNLDPNPNSDPDADPYPLLYSGRRAVRPFAVLKPAQACLVHVKQEFVPRS